ncbi:MAG: transposase [Janthinobacterium lividum]
MQLMLRLAMRQAKAFSRSVLGLLGLALPVPDYSTLSRCG